jgi:hypothetical protein
MPHEFGVFVRSPMSLYPGTGVLVIVFCPDCISALNFGLGARGRTVGRGREAGVDECSRRHAAYLGRQRKESNH